MAVHFAKVKLSNLILVNHEGEVVEGEYAVNEVMLCFSSDEVGVTSAGFVSTKDTNQLTFSASYKDDAENTMSIKAASTSGGSTTVSAYRINLLAK